MKCLFQFALESPDVNDLRGMKNYERHNRKIPTLHEINPKPQGLVQVILSELVPQVREAMRISKRVQGLKISSREGFWRSGLEFVAIIPSKGESNGKENRTKTPTGVKE